MFIGDEVLHFFSAGGLKQRSRNECLVICYQTSAPNFISGTRRLLPGDASLLEFLTIMMKKESMKS